jgi:phage shock protein PspC (stress-responsive transcriptional regulator)
MNLRRSNDDCRIAGVCGGLAKNLGWDSGRLRIVWVLATIFTAFAGVVIYLALWYLMPEEPAPQNFEPAVLQPWKKSA